MRFFLLFLVLSVSSAFAGQNETNREVIRTYAQVYLERNDYSRTQALLAEYLKTDPGDGSLWDLLGDIEMKSANYAQACHAFKKASDVYSDPIEKSIALYHFSDCLNRGGRQEDALSVLSEIVKRDESVAELADQVIDSIRDGKIKPSDQFPAYVFKSKGSLRVFGALGFGFDSNVLLVDEDVANSTATQDRGSSFFTPAAQVGYFLPRENYYIDSRYLISFTDYLSEAARTYNALYQRADAFLGFGPTRYGAFLEVLYMNRDPFQLYNWNGGLSWNRTRALSKTSVLDIEAPIRYQNFALDSRGSSENVRSGPGFQVRARYRSTLSPQSSLMAQIGLDTALTSGRNFRVTQFMLPVHYQFELPYLKDLKLLNTLQGEVDGYWYWQSDTLRKDLNMRVGTGLLRRFDGGWNASLDYSRTKNTSTIPSARYTKEIISVMVSHDFI